MPSSTLPRGNTLFIIAIFLGMLLGGVFGAIVGREVAFVTLIGELFLSGLKMMIVPLVGSSMIMGVASLGDVRRLGRLGGLTLTYYLSTTLLAAALGLLLVNLISPGAGVEATGELTRDVADYSFLDVLRGIVPANLFRALGEREVAGQRGSVEGRPERLGLAIIDDLRALIYHPREGETVGLAAHLPHKDGRRVDDHRPHEDNRRVGDHIVDDRMQGHQVERVGAALSFVGDRDYRCAAIEISSFRRLFENGFELVNGAQRGQIVPVQGHILRA